MKHISETNLQNFIDSIPEEEREEIIKSIVKRLEKEVEDGEQEV